jgi:hypothetical protein
MFEKSIMTLQFKKSDLFVGEVASSARIGSVRVEATLDSLGTMSGSTTYKLRAFFNSRRAGVFLKEGERVEYSPEKLYVYHHEEPISDTEEYVHNSLTDLMSILNRDFPDLPARIEDSFLIVGDKVNQHRRI